MANWYAVKDTQSNTIVSYTTDDAQGYGQLPEGFQYVGPFTSQEEAVADAIPAAPLPTAVISTFDPADQSKTPKTVFRKTDSIGIQVEIKAGDVRVTQFSGTWNIPIWHLNQLTKQFDEDIATIALTITNGLSDAVTIDPLGRSMIVGVDSRTSVLAQVNEYLITVTE